MDASDLVPLHWLPFGGLRLPRPHDAPAVMRAPAVRIEERGGGAARRASSGRLTTRPPTWCGYKQFPKFVDESASIRLNTRRCNRRAILFDRKIRLTQPQLRLQIPGPVIVPVFGNHGADTIVGPGVFDHPAA